MGQHTEEQLLAEARARERVLLELTQAVQGLVQERGQAEGAPSDMGGEAEDTGVRALCLAVEEACLHGIKTQVSCVRVMPPHGIGNAGVLARFSARHACRFDSIRQCRRHTHAQEFHGQLPFWDLLEAAAAQDKQEERDPNAHARALHAGATITEEAGWEEGEGEGEAEIQEDMRARHALRAVVDRVRGQAPQLKTPVGLARSALRHALHDGEQRALRTVCADRRCLCP